MSKPSRQRVYLFLTRPNGAEGQIVVRSGVQPRAGDGFGSGCETPGGTVEPGESPHAAALREAWEETGLIHLGEPELLASDEFENEDERLRRFFFQVPVLQETSDEWVHADEAEGVDQGVEFRLRWVDLPAAGGLDEHFRAYIERVRPSLGASGR